jgi:hypothetical protein
LKHDSKRAFEMLASGGVIVWDDYVSHCPGVVKAIQEMTAEVVRLRHTRLAIFKG